MMYRVYYMNRPMRTFRTRDEALNFINKGVALFSNDREDYEILDESDD